MSQFQHWKVAYNFTYCKWDILAVMAGFHVDKWNSGKGLWPNSSSSCRSAVRKEYKVKFHTTRSNEHVTHILVIIRVACFAPGPTRSPSLLRRWFCQRLEMLKLCDRFWNGQRHIMTFVGLCRKTCSGLTHQACLTINATLQRVFFFFPALTFQGLPYLGV